MCRTGKGQVDFRTVEQLEHDQFASACAEQRNAFAQILLRDFQIADENLHALVRADRIGGTGELKQFSRAFRRFARSGEDAEEFLDMAAGGFRGKMPVRLHAEGVQSDKVALACEKQSE